MDDGLCHSYPLPGQYSSRLASGGDRYPIPLTVRFNLLMQQLVQQIYPGSGRIAIVWYEGNYRYLFSDHP